MSKRIIAIVLTLLVTMSFCGCDTTITATGNSDEEVTVKKSQNIYFDISSFSTLNPVVSQDKDTYHISKLVYQSLFKTDEYLSPVNDLASSYSVSDGGKTITISLDSSSRFSDGEKVTADDVVFSVKAYQSAGKKSIYYDEVKKIKSIERKGKEKVIIKFGSEGGNLGVLTFPILPSHLYSLESLGTAKKSFKPVGSGAYKVKKLSSDTKVVLTGNKKYSGDVPDNTLYFTIYKKDAEILNLMDGNIVSFTTIESIKRNTEIGSKNLRNGNYSSNKLVYLAYNCKSSALDDKKVRQAISYAVDVQSILKKVYYKSGIYTDSMYYPGYLGLENDGDSYKLNKKKARELLAEAGWKDKNKDGYLEDEKGKKVSITIVAGDNTQRRKAASYVKEYLSDIGLNGVVVKCSGRDFKKKIKNGNFGIYIAEATMNECYDMTRILGGDLDYTGFSYKGAGKIIRNTARCLEIENMKTNTSKVKKYLNENMPYYPLFYRTYSYVISDEMATEPVPVFNNIYNGCEEWYCEYEIENSEDDEDSK